MNKSQIKTQILMIKVLDYCLVIAVIAIAIYTYHHPKNINMMMTLILLGLFILNKVGNVTLTQISKLRIELRKLDREEKSQRFQK